MYAEDFCWSFELFENGAEVSSVSIAWLGESQGIGTTYQRAPLQKLAPQIADDEWEQWEKNFTDDPMSVGRHFAQMFGLTNVQWLSYDFVNRDLEEDPTRYPGSVRVSAS